MAELGANALCAIVRECCSLVDVGNEVRANYTENRWWPLSIQDWRLRMLVAGWSTRVSYNHINHYQHVVRTVTAIGWYDLLKLTDDELLQVVRPLGLPGTRLIYLRSLADYVATIQEPNTYLQRSNDGLIDEFAMRVKGAGYKVAQCAILYAKGYHCGIIPIDSGMAEMLEPLIPAPLPHGPIRHDAVRVRLELLVSLCSAELHAIAASAGYSLGISNATAPTWWVHLVLIYYKRLYWNRARDIGPFRRAADSSSESGSTRGTVRVDVRTFPGVILEGIDGTGKSTLADALAKAGYNRTHAVYSPNVDLIEKYKQQVAAPDVPWVMDRCFISEYVYGRVQRAGSRLSLEQCLSFLHQLAERGFVAFHLEESVALLSERRPGGWKDESEAKQIIREYRAFFESAREVIPVYSLRLSQLAPDYVLRYLCDRRVERANGFTDIER